MPRARILLLAAAACLLLAPTRAAAPDVAKLRAQLELATSNQDSLARIELLRRIVEADPADAASHRLLIELWLQINDYDLAAATLDAWPAAPPDLTALTLAAVLRYRDKAIPGAIRVLRDYLRVSPKDINAHYALVSALLETNDTAAQLAALDALLKLRPQDSTALIQRANVKFRRTDYPAALADARAAQAINPDSETVKAALPAFERLEETLKALPPLDSALAKNPQDLSPLIARAWWLRYGGILDRSLADSEAAVALAPTSLAAKITRARALVLLGKIKAEDARRDDLIDVNSAHSLDDILAITAADLALARQADDPAQLLIRAHALNEAGQPLLARRDAEAILTIAPDNADAGLELLAAAANLNEDPAPTLRHIEAMKPSKGQLASAYGQIADLSLRQGKLPLALDFADKSLALRETEFPLRVKAAALQRLGRPDEATAATRRADALKR